MKKKNLHRPWIKAITFIFILAALIHVFSYIPIQRSHEKNRNYWPYFYKELPENSVDIVYMGNSHSNTAFIPEVIDNILDVNSIHVNTSGESIYQTIYEYREVLRHQDPKVVIIEANPIYAGLDQQELKPWNYSFFFSMPFGWHKLLYAHQFLQGNNLLNFYMPFTLFHSNWKHPGEVLQRIKEAVALYRVNKGEDILIELPFKGYMNYFQSLSMDEPDPQERGLKDGCSVTDLEERLAVVADIIEIDKDVDENLIFLEAPQYVNEFAACRGQVAGYIEDRGGAYEILLEGQKRARLWFGDEEHMTLFGAIMASVETAELLAGKYDLAVDEEALAFYRGFFFEDYALVREGDQLSIELIPMDEGRMPDLKFAWKLDMDGETIEEVEGMGLNAYTFTLPQEDAHYALKVYINTLSSSYSVRGGFDVPD